MSAGDAHVIWRGLLIEARQVKVRRASSGLNLGSASRSGHVTSVHAQVNVSQ